MGKAAAATDAAPLEAKAATKRKPRSTEGLAEAKAAATMTTKEWQELQVGMAKEWPAPEYMKNPPTGKTPRYRDETYSIVTRWTEETRISYRPHAKAPGTKSHVRYEGYAHARTVGEALELGTFPADWCWDYERGFIHVHGPVRDEPIDMSKVTDESSLSAVDTIIVRWYRKELARNLGLNYEDLWVGKGSGESTWMRAHRLVAQREAKKRLETAAAEGRRVRGEEVAATLREWAFARNPYRTNVMKEGQTWVWSDTLGLIIDRVGDIHITSSTTMYPAVARIIAQWLRERLPPEVASFGFTSLNLNCNYAAQLHRDKNNFGPSLITAFGDFTGGELGYWGEDDKSLKLEDIPKAAKAQHQLRNSLLMFNGNCAHEVADFEGDRFSVVYFTLGCHARAKAQDRAKLEEFGFVLPAPDADSHTLLRAPRGFSAQRLDSECLPSFRVWPTAELDTQPLASLLWAPLPEPAAQVARPKQDDDAKASKPPKAEGDIAKADKDASKHSPKPKAEKDVAGVATPAKGGLTTAAAGRRASKRTAVSRQSPEKPAKRSLLEELGARNFISVE